MLVLCALFATAVADPMVTTTELTVTPETTVWGEPTTLDVHVIAGNDLPIDGSIEVFDSGTLIVTSALDAKAHAVIGMTALAPGVHELSAEFVPADSTVLAPSQSPSVAHDVEQAGSQIVLVLHDIDTLGRTTITVRVLPVTPSVATPTGTATLYLDSVALAEGTLLQGVVAIPTRQLRVGARTVVVHYSGDQGFVDSDSTETPLIIPSEEFGVTIDPPIAKMAAGDTRDFQLTLTPTFQRDSHVSFACRGLPAGTTCEFEPTTVTIAGDPVPVTVRVAVDGELFPAAGLTLALGGLARRRKTFMTAGLLACMACGDARPIEQTVVRVVALSENISRSADLTLHMR